MSRKLDHAMTLRLPSDLRNALVAQADREDRTVAQVIRYAAREYLQVALEESQSLTDEPTFVLLARDLHAPSLVRSWAVMRAGEGENQAKVDEAFACADAMEAWQNTPEPPPDDS